MSLPASGKYASEFFLHTPHPVAHSSSALFLCVYFAARRVSTEVDADVDVEVVVAAQNMTNTKNGSWPCTLKAEEERERIWMNVCVRC